METFFKQVKQIVRESQSALEESRKRGEQFNMFKACGVNHYENTHSAIIAELLNPQGSHGQGALFLSSFKEVCCSHDFKFSFQGVEVRTEFPIDDGRIDIFVKNGNGQMIIIENKIYALDQHEQLKRYEGYAKEYYDGKYELLYLTLYGSDASEDSGKGVKYSRISYQKDIVNWLEVCIKECSRLPLIRETLIQYQNHIKQLTRQTMESIEKEKLFAIMVKNIQEVQAIYNVDWLEYLEYVFKKYVRNEFSNIEGLEYEEKNLFGPQGERGFYFRRSDWKCNAIWIYTYRSQLESFMIGISPYKEGVEEDTNEKLNCFEEQPEKYWPYGWEYLGEYKDWNLQNNTVPNMISGEFVKYIKYKVNEILKEIDKMNCKL